MFYCFLWATIKFRYMPSFAVSLCVYQRFPLFNNLIEMFSPYQFFVVVSSSSNIWSLLNSVSNVFSGVWRYVYGYYMIKYELDPLEWLCIMKFSSTERTIHSGLMSMKRIRRSFFGWWWWKYRKPKHHGSRWMDAFEKSEWIPYTNTTTVL